MASERLQEDILFLACTRPAMIFGVPMEAMGITVMVSTIAFLGAGSLLYLLIAPVLHVVFRAVCKADPNAFRVLYLDGHAAGQARMPRRHHRRRRTPRPAARPALPDRRRLRAPLVTPQGRLTANLAAGFGPRPFDRAGAQRSRSAKSSKAEDRSTMRRATKIPKIDAPGSCAARRSRQTV